MSNSGNKRRAGEILTCSSTVSDPDGESPTVDHIWLNGSDIIHVNYGMSASDTSELSLTNGNAVREDQITCQVTVYDSFEGTTTATSEAIAIVNTAPELKFTRKVAHQPHKSRSHYLPPNQHRS